MEMMIIPVIYSEFEREIVEEPEVGSAYWCRGGEYIDLLVKLGVFSRGPLFEWVICDDAALQKNVGLDIS
jgi:hypothetical protein